MKKFLALFTATIVLTSSMTVFAAPKEVDVNGDKFTFDAEYYANNNPDVVAALGNSADAMLQHYVQYGRSEGRAAYNGDAGAKATTTTATATKSVESQPTYIELYETDGTVAEKIYCEHDENGRISKKTVWNYIYGTPSRASFIYTYSYNENGDMARETITDAGTGDVYGDNSYSYEYDSQGRISVCCHGSTRIDYVYDANGRLSKQNETYNGLSTGTCTYTYNKKGQLTKKTHDLATGYDYTYTYDKQGRIATETNMCGTTYYYYD